jgi:biogenesis of lysosome-related organelles complex 1 subunit 2
VLSAPGSPRENAGSATLTALIGHRLLFTSTPGSAIPDGEESKERCSSVLEELAYECMELSPVQVAWPRLSLAIGKAWGQEIAPREQETVALDPRADLRIRWWLRAKHGEMSDPQAPLGAAAASLDADIAASVQLQTEELAETRRRVGDMGSWPRRQEAGGRREKAKLLQEQEIGIPSFLSNLTVIEQAIARLENAIGKPERRCALLEQRAPASPRSVFHITCRTQGLRRSRETVPCSAGAVQRAGQRRALRRPRPRLPRAGGPRRRAPA